MLILVGVFGQAVGVASFPFMARLAVEGRLGEMNRLMDRTLRHLSLVIPISVLCMVLRHEIVLLLFQRGRFDEGAARITSQALLYFLPGAFAFAAQTIVVRAYYAVQNTLFPALFGTLAVVLSLPFYWVGMRFMGPSGVALAVSVSAVLQVGLLYHIWNARRRDREYRRVYGAYGRMVGWGLGLGVLFEALKRYLVPSITPLPMLQAAWTCLVVGSIFLAVLFLFGRRFKVPEIESFLALRKKGVKSGKNGEKGL